MKFTAPLRIDFSRNAQKAKSGSVLLVTGALAFSISVAWLVSITQELEKVQTQVRDITQLLRRSPAKIEAARRDDREIQKEVSVANLVIQQLSIPWDLLFSDVESAASSDVALLSVQPDAANRLVRINGEAKEFMAIIGFIRRLEDADNLGNIVLQGHEVKTQDPLRPVVFSITAAWSIRP
jgi:hypothetical protein